MRVSGSFQAYVLDQLSEIEGLRARPMFGGVGLYAGDVFFGLLAADVLYLKVDDTNRPDYETAGCHPFRPYPDRPGTMPYYDVPVGVLEDAVTLAAWAHRSIAIAKASPTRRR
jgi:DNA transformation protein and related proteins